MVQEQAAVESGGNVGLSSVNRVLRPMHYRHTAGYFRDTFFQVINCTDSDN